MCSTPDGTAIPGLWAIGACAAQTASGTGYNSGFALGRGLTAAYLVVRGARGCSADGKVSASPPPTG